jgi:HD superfamily phosphohydrolase
MSVMHHPLGTDKFSYLSLDAYHCLSSRPPDLEKIAEYTIWLAGQIVAHVKCVTEATELKRFYVMMYRDVYLKKSCIIGQRVLEKIIHDLLREGRLSEAALWEMTDADLVAKVCEKQEYAKRFDRYRHRDSKCAVAFRYTGFSKIENTMNKPLVVFEKTDTFFNFIADHADPASLSAMEEELAHELKINPNDIDIVPPMSPWRFAPKEIPVFTNNELVPDTYLLPKNQEAIMELARASTVLRVCVSRHLRARAARKAKTISAFLDDTLRRTR